MKEATESIVDKLESCLDSILCFCAEGPEFLTDYEIRKAVESEAIKCLERLNKGENSDISVRQS